MEEQKVKKIKIKHSSKLNNNLFCIICGSTEAGKTHLKHGFEYGLSTKKFNKMPYLISSAGVFIYPQETSHFIPPSPERRPPAVNRSECLDHQPSIGV